MNTSRLLFVNKAAGRNDALPACLANFEPHDIADAATVLAPLVSTLREGDRMTVAVWGGDGSMRTVAGLIAGTPAVLLPCPGGSRNHFCRAVGINDVTDVERALADGQIRSVDLGRAGDEVFLNNVAVGWYTDLVTRRERYQRHMPRRLAKFASLPVQLLRTRRLRVVVDQTPERVWLVWVGNGEFSTESTQLTHRASMDDGLLDVRILRAGSRWPKLRAMVEVVKGNAESSRHIVRQLLQTTVLTTREAFVRAALDGELSMLPTPVEITVDRYSLRVLAPRRPDSSNTGGEERSGGAEPG